MDSDLTHIFNLLKYFTNFEDDSSSSDCKYHIKLHTKQNKRSLKTPKISPTKSNQNLNTNSNYKCWLDNLPDLVKTKIFKFMSHKSLIDFTNAFPKYKNFIVNPVFWSKIKINFDGHDEHHHIEHILKYLNDNLKQIYVNFTKIRNGNFETYLLNMPKLTHFSLHGLKKAHSSEYEYLVDLLATKLAYLKYIDITHFEINDDQLAKLSLHLNNLNSIKLYADNLSDGGLYNFVNNTKKLVYLEIIGSKLCKLKNPKSFELLYTRHSQSLEALKFQSLKIDNNAFKSIDKCIKLKELSIKNCKIVNFEVLKFIASCKKLKSLEIDNNKGFDGQAFLEFFKNSTMMNLKRLHLKNCRLDDESLKLLASWYLNFIFVYLYKIKYVSFYT